MYTTVVSHRNMIAKNMTLSTGTKLPFCYSVQISYGPLLGRSIPETEDMVENRTKPISIPNTKDLTFQFRANFIHFTAFCMNHVF